MPTDKIRKQRYDRRVAKRNAKMLERLEKYNDPFLVTNFNHMLVASERSKDGVRWKPSVQKWQMNEFLNCMAAIDELESLNTNEMRLHRFKVHERGKVRDIQSVDVKERAIQHSLVDNVCYPLFTASFIYDNGASIVGKGVTFTIHRVKHQLSKMYRRNGFSNDIWVLLIDLHSFFASIDHDVLYSMVDKYIYNDILRTKIHQIVDSFDEGLGLGCQLSQILSLLYLNKIDHYIKEVIRCKCYSRFMDDLFLAFQTKEEAETALAILKEKFSDIKISINPKKTKIINLSNQTFVYLKKKFILTKSGKIVIHDAAESGKNMRHKLRKLRQVYDAGEIDIYYIRQLIDSWYGMKKEFMSYEYLQKFKAYSFTLFPELKSDTIFKKYILNIPDETRLPGDFIIPEHFKYVFNK